MKGKCVMKHSAIRKLKKYGNVNAALAAKIYAYKAFDSEGFEIFKQGLYEKLPQIENGGWIVAVSPWGEVITLNKNSIIKYFN
jgi:hypothetical protein